MAKETACDILEAEGIASVGADELSGFPKSADEPIFLVFVASWCEVSLEAAPGLARALLRLGERARLAHVDVDVRALDTERLGVRSVPAVVLLARGREIARTEGRASEEEIAAFSEKALGEVPAAGAGEGAKGAEGAEDVPAAPGSRE